MTAELMQTNGFAGSAQAVAGASEEKAIFIPTTFSYVIIINYLLKIDPIKRLLL